MSRPVDEKARLTAAQWCLLRSIHRDGVGVHPTPAEVLTFDSLCRRGLIGDKGLTEAGRERLIQAGDIPPESP